MVSFSLIYEMSSPPPNFPEKRYYSSFPQKPRERKNIRLEQEEKSIVSSEKSNEPSMPEPSCSFPIPTYTSFTARTNNEEISVTDNSTLPPLQTNPSSFFPLSEPTLNFSTLPSGLRSQSEESIVSSNTVEGGESQENTQRDLWKEVLEYYEQGYSLRQMEKLTGISRTTLNRNIHKYLEFLGLQRKTPNRNFHSPKYWIQYQNPYQKPLTYKSPSLTDILCSTSQSTSTSTSTSIPTSSFPSTCTSTCTSTSTSISSPTFTSTSTSTSTSPTFTPSLPQNNPEFSTTQPPTTGNFSPSFSEPFGSSTRSPKNMKTQNITGKTNPLPPLPKTNSKKKQDQSDANLSQYKDSLGKKITQKKFPE